MEEDKERELALREREVAAKEQEVSARVEELRRSRWLNPTVLGLFAASIGLISTVVVARINNANTQEVQRLQSETNLTLEAIKTVPGNTDAACNNLVFFVKLGLLRDPQHLILQVCPAQSKKPEPPSLPAAPTGARVHTPTPSSVPVDNPVPTLREAALKLGENLKRDTDAEIQKYDQRVQAERTKNAQSAISQGLSLQAANEIANSHSAAEGRLNAIELIKATVAARYDAQIRLLLAGLDASPIGYRQSYADASRKVESSCLPHRPHFGDCQEALDNLAKVLQ